MRVEMYKISYGNYKFTAEIDTGAEVGDNQITLWYCEKIPMDALSLAQINTQLLLKALKEPHKSLLMPYLDEIKQNHKQTLEQEMSAIIKPYSSQKLPGEIKRKIRRMREKIRVTLEQLETQFMQQEILTLERTCFDLDAIEKDYQIYGEWKFLRDFLFEEATYENIRNFCHDFASNPSTRSIVESREGRWIKRNALYTRNLLSVVGEQALLANDGSYMRLAREFFRWLDLHLEEILNHPEYQHLNKLDSIDKTSTHESDTYIRPAIELFKTLPGIAIRYSCQGVSGKVNMNPYEILTITPHEEFASITFSGISYLIHDAISARLSQFASITTQRIPCNFTAGLILRSTGNNLRFREELYLLARQLHYMLDTEQRELSPTTPVKIIQAWENANHPEYPPQIEHNGGILAGRLTWLCQPENIEYTLSRLNHFNHWAKARDLLYYEDRQSLYNIKALLIKEAYQSGTIQLSGYIDGSPTFPFHLMINHACYMAGELLLETLKDSQSSNHEETARHLFQRLTGQPFQAPENVEQLDQKKIEGLIQNELEELIQQALQRRQPIPYQQLEALLIYPMDLLNTTSRYLYDWDTLNAGDLRKLDPEGLSLLSFHYESDTASYIFHLPYRTGEEFLPAKHIQQIKGKASQERQEYGTFYGRAITEEESINHPIEEILYSLGIYIGRNFPRRLERKKEQFQPLHNWNLQDFEDEEYPHDTKQLQRKKNQQA
ncbi:hypothetical protein KDA_19950 [Dictyobacter alpinus]|uniref:Uncharacterized protein n=1 Tax=Dictyobacter alpinus TaxID=2014873 RepID=A0A402B585_9CHLR|nr:hypothetical protein [Dictyobacter alpinus]GCE26511.1 hypothetical protein KDA_19950 [Dictyobacter alpinus]